MSSDEDLRSASADIGRLPDAYREPLWEDISRSWDRQAARRTRVRTITGWGAATLALAVVLTVGILIGRVSNVQVPDESDQAALRPAPRPTLESTLPTPYRVALSEHFRQAETLLTLFDASAGTDADLAHLARDLAVTTRLLADSRAGENAEMRRTLLDLELLLVQIARAVDEDDATEREVVREGVEESTVLPRLRRWLPEETAAVAI